MLMASPCTSIPAICLCCPSPLRSRLTILPPLDSHPTCLPRGFHSTGHQSKLSQTSSCSNALYFGSGPPDPGLFRPRPWTSPWMRPVSAPPSDLVPSLQLFAASLKQLFLTLSRETFCCCSIGRCANFPYQTPFLLPCFLTSGHKGTQVRQKVFSTVFPVPHTLREPGHSHKKR